MGVRMTSDSRQKEQRLNDIRQRLEYCRLRKACNASLRCGIECPIWDRTPEHCEFCGNQNCIESKKALDELWAEKDTKL